MHFIVNLDIFHLIEFPGKTEIGRAKGALSSDYAQFVLL